MNLLAVNRRHVLIGVALLALTAVLAYVAFRMGPLAPVRITVTQVKNDRITPSVFGIGTVEARQSWQMGPTSVGRVLRVHLDVGDRVEAGRLLLEMDPLDLEQRLHAQDAALSRAASVMVAAKAQLADFAARRELAASNFLRQQELARQHFISPGALESRQQELASADAALQAGQANLQAADQEIERLRSERAAVALQRQNIRLLAPADAVVISRDAEVGNTVLAGQPILKLAEPASLWVKVRVDQGRSNGLVVGLPAKIALRSQPQLVWPGKVERVELLADAVTEERIAYVTFRQLPPSASIGEMAEVTLDRPISNEAPTVPQASVQLNHGLSGAWRLTDGMLEFVAVDWGMSSLDGRVQAVKGLQPGDTVVVYSEKPLRPGISFRVVDTLVEKTAP